MNNLVPILLVILAIPATLSCGYLMLLTLLSAKPRPQLPTSKVLRFDLIVPAHNEAPIIARAIASLQRIDWPDDRFRILVVADNCTDATADIASASGAEVLVRNDPTSRGKGYALQYAFNVSRARQWADAVVVVDADSDVSSNILEACAARIESGAQAVQAHYGVRNSMLSWRTRLLTIATTSFMMVRSRAREKLRLSCGIRGNGWCVTHRLLALVPYRAFSLAEDVEYGIALGLAGYRVAYADEAHAYSDMVTSEHIARTQRQRWENGRFQLVRSKTLPLLAAAMRLRSAQCLDLGLDLLVLPLSYVVLNVLAVAILSVLGYWQQTTSVAFVWVAITCCTFLVLYVGRGWQLSGIGVQGLWDLSGAPWFLIWKLCLNLRRRAAGEWVRTQREEH
jgi:cellulose synthase/poly-beta-1,6-N-acetylglucosamine synthase-like glycosyltransferase